MYMPYMPTVAVYVKIVLLAIIGGIGLYKLTTTSERFNSWRKRITATLIICTLVAIGAFYHFGHFLNGHFNNYHDVMHYYFGSKYSHEVGYFDLYKCMVIAESDGRNMPMHYKNSYIRLMENYNYRRIENILEDPTYCTKRFTKERWEEFKEDIKMFGKVAHNRYLNKRLRDMGYNATPVWNMIGRLISENVRPSRWNVIAFGFIDIFLMIGAFIGIYAAFGLIPTLLAFIFFCSIYPIHNMFIHGSILRFDWLAAILLSVACVKKKYYAIAGALLGYAATVRIFPLLFVFGMGVKAAWTLLTTRKLPVRYVAFFASWAVAIGLLFGASVATWGGFDQWQDFSKKMAIHSTSMSAWRVGWMYITMFEGATKRSDFNKIAGTTKWGAIVKHKHEVLKNRWALRWGGVLIGLLLTALVIRRLEDHESIAFSYPALFFMLGPSIYYSTVLCILALLFMTRSDDRNAAIAWVTLIAGMIVTYVLSETIRFELFRHFLISIAFLLTLLIIFWAMLRDDEELKGFFRRIFRKSEKEVPSPQPE